MGLSRVMTVEAPNLKLLGEVEEFLDRHGISASRFGTLAMGNPSFVLRLRAGANLTSESIVRARAWMVAYKAQKSRKSSGNGQSAAA